MRAVLSCSLLAVAGCLPHYAAYDDYVANVEGIWDGHALTIEARYRATNGSGDGYAYEPASLSATLRGESYALEQTIDPDSGLFAKYYYQAIIPLDSPPDGEEVTVEPAAPAPAAVFTVPPSFELAALPPPPIALPLTIRWAPSATNLMEWTVSGDCIGTLDPARVSYSDVNYLDAGLFVFSVGSDKPTPCDFTLEIERYHFHSSTPDLVGATGTQRRTVAFTANLEAP